MKSKSDKLSKARHELSEMYEGTRHHGRKGQSYWGNWLGENDWWFEIVSDALKEDKYSKGAMRLMGIACGVIGVAIGIALMFAVGR